MNIKKFFLILAVLSIALSATAFPARAATCTQYHRVRAGESLYGIGLTYGVTWRYLAQINNIANPGRIFAGQQLCVSQDGTTTPPVSSTPSFRVASVVADKTVTIQGTNFPANDKFKVFIGRFGTAGVGGVRVATVKTGAGGSVNATVNIPAEFAGVSRLAIRLQSPLTGRFMYSWFYNNTSGTGTGGEGVPSPSRIPTFSIASVARDASVTIRTRNFPANVSFDVLMGRIGTRAVNGIKVTSVNSGSGGEMTLTFNIPAELRGLRQIAIRLQSPSTGYFSYNWFYNSTTP
jgi:LysM domain-containing protein